MTLAPDPSRANRGRRLAALSVGQIVSWGVLYYALIVAAPRIADQTEWPLPAITALFSLGLIISAMVGIVTGRLLDNRGPRLVMTLGSTIGVAGFVLVALSPNLLVFGVA